MTIPGMDERSVRGVLRQTYDRSMEDDILTCSAALAFHVVLALFPFLAFVIALLALFDLGPLLSPMLDWAQRTLPPQGVQQVRSVVEHLRGSHPAVLSFGMLAAIWAASGGIRSAMHALNRAYDVKEQRGTWKRLLWSIIYTIALAILAVIAMVLLFVGPELITRLSASVGLAHGWVEAWRWIRFPLALLLLMVGCALFYSALPATPGFRWLTPGAVVAVLLWLVASWLFRLYSLHLVDYGAVYGSLAAIIVLLLYTWLSALILIGGAELNGTLRAPARDERERPRRSRANGSHRTPLAARPLHH